VTKAGEGVTPRLLWDGDGTNANAALTVFRHFDSATVVKGLVGRAPKSA
jgi:Fatty acid cis/trans isomerase (CTI)